MRSAGRIALAAAAATSLVSGTAAALDAANAHTTQVADQQVDPHAAAKARLGAQLNRLDARAHDLQRQLKSAGHDLSTAERALLQAKAEAARRAAAALAAQQAAQQQVVQQQQQPTVTTTQPAAPQTHTTTGASSATASGDDNESEVGDD